MRSTGHLLTLLGSLRLGHPRPRELTGYDDARVTGRGCYAVPLHCFNYAPGQQSSCKLRCRFAYQPCTRHRQASFSGKWFETHNRCFTSLDLRSSVLTSPDRMIASLHDRNAITAALRHELSKWSIVLLGFGFFLCQPSRCGKSLTRAFVLLH